MMISFPITIAALLIDLDGTLADTVPDLADAVDAMLNELGRQPLGVDRVRKLVGRGVADLVERSLNSDNSDSRSQPVMTDSREHHDAIMIFRRHYRQSNGCKSRLYPGVREGLTALRKLGLKLACVTNKAEEFTVPLLDILHLSQDFHLVVCGDTLTQKKPHPAPLLHACQCLNVPPRQALMVGDSVHDVAAARAAGCPVFCVPYGYIGSTNDHPAKVDSLKADALISSFVDIMSLVDVNVTSNPLERQA